MLHHLDLRRLDVGLLGDDLADAGAQVAAAARAQLLALGDIVLDAFARQSIVEQLASALRARVRGNRDLVGLGRRRHRAQHLGFVEQLPLIGIGLLGAGAEPLVRRQPQLLFEPLDLERLLAHQRLQRSRIVRQIGRAWWGLVHARKE